MNSRERIIKAIDHEDTDKLPVDFGGGLTTSIHVSMVYKLRQYYGLDKPGTPVKIIEPFMCIGEIKDDLREIFGSDVKMLHGSKAIFFDFPNDGWKEWAMPDGAPVLVPKLFNTEPNPDGSIFLYPQGDKSTSPSAKMPKNGYYFDAIIRQGDVDFNNLNPDDNKEEFGIINDKEIDFLQSQAESIYSETKYAIYSNAVFSSFGDIAAVPGMSMKNPKGIRDTTEWYIATVKYKDFVKEIFDYQCNIAIENYKKIYNAIGNKINITFIMGTDFGTQSGLFMSIESFKELYKPFIKRVNSWIHKNTKWKTLVHSCGSVYDLIPEFIDCGYDIYNPVQVSAAKMQPEKLKAEFGKYITFWGGGVDNQKILPFGTPKDVKKDVRKNIEIFSKGSGYVFANIHNMQVNIPIENVVAMIEVIQEYR